MTTYRELIEDEIRVTTTDDDTRDIDDTEWEREQEDRRMQELHQEEEDKRREEVEGGSKWSHYSYISLLLFAL